MPCDVIAATQRNDVHSQLNPAYHQQTSNAPSYRAFAYLIRSGGATSLNTRYNYCLDS